MNSPPNNLASLLGSVPNAYPNAAAPAAGEEGNHEAFMTYLRDTYEPVPDDGGAQNRYLPSPSYRFTPGRLHVPPSPPDPTVPIPSSLADIAAPYASATDGPFTFSLPPAVGLDEAFTDTLDRGEMGGKRRKPPHERAGWKEMDDEKRGEKRRHDSLEDDHAQAATAAAGTGVGEVATGAVSAGAEGENANGNADGAAEAAATLLGFETTPAQPTEGQMQTEAQAEGDDELKPSSKRQQKSKEARAEQNRKAQQIFRRKREEKIKQLELDSMALGNTRQRLMAAEQRLADMALELEAKMIESQGLRRALSTAVSVSGSALVKPDGSLVLSLDDYERRDRSKVTTGELDTACDSLARASRQLAKANRQRRDQLRQHAES